MSATPHQRGNTPALMVTIPKPTMPTVAANKPTISTAAVRVRGKLGPNTSHATGSSTKPMKADRAASVTCEP